jgi:hypothetical protein
MRITDLKKIEAIEDRIESICTSERINLNDDTCKIHCLYFNTSVKDELFYQVTVAVKKDYGFQPIEEIIVTEREEYIAVVSEFFAKYSMFENL